MKNAKTLQISENGRTIQEIGIIYPLAIDKQVRGLVAEFSANELLDYILIDGCDGYPHIFRSLDDFRALLLASLAD